MTTAGMAMNELVKGLMKEVAEIVPALKPRHDHVAVDAPNFPNDLEPVIRSEYTSQEKDNVEV